ncbi:thrombospondin type 3 repeat-containing protein [Myxococcota bacterium]|nr:thrombospondin type 3 repeat-containing protein [Myxococcota bacterium]
MWPGGARADTCTAASQSYFSWHNWGATAWNMTGYPDYVRPRNLQPQGDCRISTVYALIQAAEINYRLRNNSYQISLFTGHENPPDVNAIRVDFSEESARSAYFQEQAVEMACNEDVDPVDFVEVLGHHGYPDYQYHRIVPQWRSPNRTIETGMLDSFVQPHLNYHQDYVVFGQTISSPWLAIEQYLQVDGAAYSIQTLKDNIACAQTANGFLGTPLASVYVDSAGDYVPVATGAMDSQTVVVIGWETVGTDVEFIILDPRFPEEILRLGSEYLVGHPLGFQLVHFTFSTNFPLPTDDSDLDGSPDTIDNCPSITNYDQALTDLDGDGTGDSCDEDLDGDGVPNTGSPMADLNPMFHFQSVDLNGNGISERSTVGQVGNRYRTYGCETECTGWYPDDENARLNCMLSCEYLSISPILPLEDDPHCKYRNYFHPGCMQQVKLLAETVLPMDPTPLLTYLASFQPCALVHQTKVQSYQEIVGKIEAGDLAFAGWPSLSAFETWIGARQAACTTYMRPEDWPNERSISVTVASEGKSKNCGPGCFVMYHCSNSAFQVTYTKDTQIPAVENYAWLFVQAADDHAMISGCPCQGQNYPLYCFQDRCQMMTSGPEPRSDNANDRESNSWDPLYGSCPSAPTPAESSSALPPYSSFCTNRSVTASTNRMTQRMQEFYDYDLWIEDGGPWAADLDDYQEMTPFGDGTFTARYSKHYSFDLGVPENNTLGRAMADAKFSDPNLRIPTDDGCVGKFYVYNWISNKIRIIPDAVSQGPQWGLWKVGSENQLVLGLDTTGTRTHQMAQIDDSVMAMRVLSSTNPEDATFLAARSASGVLNNFRKYRYQNHTMVDEGTVTFEKLPAMISASLIPIDASNSLLIGKTNATTLRAYKITVSGSTGTITTVGSLFNTTSFDAAWEQTTPSVLITIFTNTAGKVRKYTTNGTSLTFRYELNLNVPVHSVARTDLGSVAILGNEVFKLGESTPTVTVLGAYPDLPADLNGFTLVPRTSLRLWGKGGDGKLDGYQYYPQLGEWETVQCLQRLD